MKSTPAAAMSAVGVCALRKDNMKAPNLVAVLIITAAIAVLQYIASDAASFFQAAWVPVVVLAIGAVVKALEVYRDQAQNGDIVLAASERKSFVRRMLTD
jgi:hypothetical protein